MKNKYELIHDKILKDLQNNKRVSMMKLIRVYCLECCGYSGADVDACTAEIQSESPCLLWPFRMGVRPKAMRLTRKPKEAVKKD